MEYNGIIKNEERKLNEIYLHLIYFLSLIFSVSTNIINHKIHLGYLNHKIFMHP